MSAKPNFYWPVFITVAALGTAAVWRFAPMAPLSPEARAFCVELTHKALQGVGLEAKPDSNTVQVASVKVPPVRQPVTNTPPKTARTAAVATNARPEKARAATNAVPKIVQVPANIVKTAQTTNSAASDVKKKNQEAAQKKPQTPPEVKPPTNTVKRAKKKRKLTEEEKQALEAERAAAMTPKQRKRKYDELTKLAEERRRMILQENLSQSREGKKALAAVKKFKKFAAEVERLKERYGETDSRVVSKRGTLLRLRDEVRRTNENYKKWKEKNPDKFITPEQDTTYRKIIGRRQLYSE